MSRVSIVIMYRRVTSFTCNYGRLNNNAKTIMTVDVIDIAFYMKEGRLFVCLFYKIVFYLNKYYCEIICQYTRVIIIILFFSYKPHIINKLLIKLYIFLCLCFLLQWCICHGRYPNPVGLEILLVEMPIGVSTGVN